MRELTAVLFIALVAGGLCIWLVARQKSRKETATYRNPVDSKAYVASGGWKTYEPDTPRKEEPGEKVKIEHIRLLMSQDDIAARTSAEELSAFILAIGQTAKATLSKANSPFRLLAQFSCSPTGHTVRLARQGDVTPEVLQAFYDALQTVKGPPVKNGEVLFQIEFSITP